GDRVGALKVAEEAVESWRGLVARVPGAFEAELAMALNNLGASLGDCGDRVGALKAAEEAAELVERSGEGGSPAVEERSEATKNLLDRLAEEKKRW
ncbi:tetratricopeptide repeat protein, partial [Tessaracoccus sp. OH4464_COT-324]|uniref:tetratricopeptide repeat protein n=1 Tax=Tessaracoccus sp. OH4464_COT-324 TaxID=2491059 RepID=UPI000F63B961